MRKSYPDKRLLGQYLVVITAFFIMVMISNNFAGNIVGKHLATYGEEVITASAETLQTYLESYQVALEDIAYKLEDLYQLNADAEVISQEMKRRGDRLHDNDTRYGGFYYLYGIVGDEYISGSDWDFPDDVDWTTRAWYEGAYSSDGIFICDPYIDLQTGDWITSLSMVMRDDDGKPFGVLAFDILLSTISDYVNNLQFMNHGYGGLLDSQMRFIIHPVETVFGEYIDLHHEEAAKLMRDNDTLNGYNYLSLTGVESVLFSRKLFNGWYLYISTPNNEYYRDVNTMFAVLSLTGLAATLVLCGILTVMYKAQTRSASLLESVTAQAATAQEEHKRAKSMLDAIPFGCKMWDKDLNIFDCNRAVVNLFELKDEQEFMRRFFELSPDVQPDGTPSQEKAAKYIKKAFTEGRQVFEWMHQLADGTPIPSEVTLVRVDYGEDIAVAGIIRDLREYKQMMAEIDRRNDLMGMENHTAEILFSTETETEKDADIESLLLRSMEYLGQCMEVDRVHIWKNEMAGGSINLIHHYRWHSETGKLKTSVPLKFKLSLNEYPEWEKVFLRGEHINGPVSKMSAKDQAFFKSFEIKAVVVIPLFVQDQFWGLFSLDDCTRERTFSTDEINILHSISLMMASTLLRHNMSIEIREALKEAKAANTAKSDFLSNMSHEIRTPMNAVLGMTELLLSEPLNKRQHSYVHDINVAGRSLLSIINDILDMSKIEAGKFEFNPVNYNLLALLDHLNSMFKFVAEKKGIEFKYEAAPDLPDCLFGDDLRLRQALTNICGNAVKFTEHGYVRLKVTKTNGQIMFEIKDTGKGIKKEDMGKLFNAFSQVDTHKNRSIVGTGLGLAISKSFVEMMGGSISFDSEYGVGTVFTLMIPIVEGSEDDIRHEVNEKENETHKVIAPNAKVLVVDDNDFNLRVAVGLLRMSKIEAATATSGKEAIEMVKQNDYDIIFMDHMMPELDGVETTAAIRSLGGKYSDDIIIALTANALFGAKEMYLANGFNGFISKPIDVNELNEHLSEFLPPHKIERATEPEPVQDEMTVQEEAVPETVSSSVGSVPQNPDSPSDFFPVRGDDFMDALDRVEAIDKTIGLSHAGGIVEMYKEMLEIVCEDFMPECDKMTEALNNGDIKSFAISVHGMKSVLSTIGAMELSEMALALELAAKKDEADFCLENYPKLLDKLVTLNTQLNVIFHT